MTHRLGGLNAKRETAFVPQRFTELRKAKGITQRDIMTLMGISDQQLSRYEAGTSEPSPIAIKKLAEILDCPTDYLMGVTDDPELGVRAGVTLTAKQTRILSRYERGEYLDLMRDLIDELKQKAV